MLRNNLKELMAKPIITENYFNMLDQKIVNSTQEEIKEIFKDNNFIDELISSNNIVIPATNQSLIFYFMIATFYNHPSLFPILIEDEKFKKVFIDNCFNWLKEKREIPFFEMLLNNKTAEINFQTIMKDNELRNCFCESRHAGRTLISFTKENPKYIKHIISDPELRKAVGNDRLIHVAMREILDQSIDKNDLDLFLSCNDGIWGYNNELKIAQQDTIAKNYRASLPDSLYKLCLFAVTDNNVLINKSIPSELSESIRNFSITNKPNNF